MEGLRPVIQTDPAWFSSQTSHVFAIKALILAQFNLQLGPTIYEPEGTEVVRLLNKETSCCRECPNTEKSNHVSKSDFKIQLLPYLSQEMSLPRFPWVEFQKWKKKKWHNCAFREAEKALLFFSPRKMKSPDLWEVSLLCCSWGTVIWWY